MEFIMNLIPNTTIEWLIAAAIMAALSALIKNLPGIIDAYLADGIEEVFKIGGPDEDWLFVQFLIYLEKKHGRYANADKAKAAVDKMISMLPLKYRIFAGTKVREKTYELVTAIFEMSKARIEREANRDVQI